MAPERFEAAKQLVYGTKAIEAGKWPAWAQGVALLRAPEDRGVGDTVERWASKFGGAQFKAMSRAVGLPCRCADRREAWNRSYPY